MGARQRPAHRLGRELPAHRLGGELERRDADGHFGGRQVVALVTGSGPVLAGQLVHRADELARAVEHRLDELGAHRVVRGRVRVVLDGVVARIGGQGAGQHRGRLGRFQPG